MISEVKTIMRNLQLPTFSMLFLLGMAASANAYIDPVTGSFVLQGAIGAIAAVLASFRSVRVKVISLFRRKPVSGKSTPSDVT
jgi:hypothetical protein